MFVVPHNRNLVQDFLILIVAHFMVLHTVKKTTNMAISMHVPLYLPSQIKKILDENLIRIIYCSRWDKSVPKYLDICSKYMKHVKLHTLTPNNMSEHE